MRLSRVLWIAALASLLGAACSDSGRNDNFSEIASESAFDPKPDDTTTIESQLMRYKGQTAFLNPGESIWNGRYLTASRSEDGQGSREIQESDIFKIGPDGSKILYLLNNYRGLQVVSFADGPEAPSLVGRVDATGNWPDDMYFDRDHNRLVVLENIYATTDMDYYSYSSQQSRLVTYDVADSTKPAIDQKITLEGRIRESRIVGDVLYIATSVRPSYADQHRGDSGKGYIYSFSLTGTNIQQVDMLTLSAPVNYSENMNIIETRDNGELRYYLVAVLDDYSRWSWFGQKPLEVVDITDPRGMIKPLMVVEAKGRVSERSQTTIKNGALVVTSNFTNSANRLRIAVESFLLPTADSPKIDSFEAEYRKMSIDRATRQLRDELTRQGLPADIIDDRVAALREQLTTSGDLALKGYFVRKDGQRSLSKLIPDAVVTVGSTQGLNARLQDVRYNENLLYAFWVPANNIDPLDVFDISDPKALKHLSHLEFDGWIQRSIPISHAGKMYIVGLGWIIPAVNNDDMRRYPQAMLFEVTKTNDGSVTTKVVSQKNLSQSSIWANFDTPDKNIEFRMTAEGKGMLLYPFSSWASGSYTSGGQLVGIDLSKIDSDPANVFTAGGILKGEEGWLRRIFTNPEIDRINTFTDMALGTFNVGENLGVADQFIEAANILELARNIVDYQSYSRDGVAYGIQVVSSDYWWSRSTGSKTMLRLVSGKNADAEFNQIVASAELAGTYVDAVIERDKRLLVMMRTWKQPEETQRSWNQELTLYEIDLSSAPQSFTVTSKASMGTFVYKYHYNTEPVRNFLRMSDGSIVAAFENQAFLIGQSSGSQLSLSGIDSDRCITSDAEEVHFHEFEGRIWTHYVEKVTDPERANFFYDRHFVAEVSADGSTCANRVNTPGIPMMIRSNGQVVTQDNRLLEITSLGGDRYTYYDTLTEKILSSLRYQPAMGTAALVDLYDAEDREITSLKTLPTGHLMFVESTQKPSYWFDSFSDRSVMPRRYPGGSQSNRLAVIGADDEFNFTKRSFQLPLSQNLHATLVATEIIGDKTIAVTKQGTSYSVWKIDSDWNLTRARLRSAADSSVTVEKVSVPGWSYGTDKQVNLSQQGTSLEIINGYFGIFQFRITD